MDYRFEDTLTELDAKRHISYSVTIPPNSTRLTLLLAYAPDKINAVQNLLTLTLFDPDGFRGAGHRGGARHVVQITDYDATPGYLPGPLPAGEWTVQIDTHMVLPGQPCKYVLDVHVDSTMGNGNILADADADSPAQPVTFPMPRPARGPGWYRGDLHSHTVHSDSGQTVAELVQAAQDHHLDFIFLTDHNTTSGLLELAQIDTGDLVAMGGIELTTFWGHALCLGAHDWIDWRVHQHDDSLGKIALHSYAAEQLFIIAHPKDIGDPVCTGCRWLYPNMMPGTARLVEVWNGPWTSNGTKNPDGLDLYYQWLNEGHRLVATAGSDTHDADYYGNNPGFSVVYAPELTEKAILQAIGEGHLYLSAGPQLSFGGTDPRGTPIMMGDQVTGQVSDPGMGNHAHLEASWADCPPGATVQVIENGEIAHRWPADRTQAQQWRVDMQKTRWTLVEIRAANNDMLAMSNPIFFSE